MSTVGKFTQQTIHEATGVTQQRQVQRAKVDVFGRGILLGRLYAAYASYEGKSRRLDPHLSTLSTLFNSVNALLHRARCAQVLAAQDHKAASQDEEGDQGIWRHNDQDRHAGCGGAVVPLNI